MPSTIARSSHAALASWSRPVSTNVIRLRKPPSKLIATLVVGGAGSPRVPLIRTRSGPTSSRRIVSKRATTSGLAYAGAPISYSSWAVTVSTVTRPPVPGCLVITARAVVGRPRRSGTRAAATGRASSPKKAKLPPVVCAPHSMTWPATTAPARRSQSVGAQPHHHAAGPTTSAASVTRGHTTTSAPASSARGDAPAAEVGVGAHRVGGQRRAGVEVVEVRAQPVDAVEQVVALDVGDAHVDAEPVGDVAHPLGAAGRVEPAGVGDDLDATLDARAEDLLHLGQERRRRSRRRRCAPWPSTG